MKRKIIGTSRDHLLVLLEEEFGYRYWFWFPLMSDEDLINWWRDLDSVDPYSTNPERLPGELYQAEQDDDFNLFHSLSSGTTHYQGHINLDDESFLQKPNGEKVYHRGYSV